MKNILQGLKTYSRPIDEEVSLMSLNEAIDETLSFSETLYNKDKVFIGHLVKVKNAQINGNMDKMQQILINLMNNAYDAVMDSRKKFPEREGKIEIILGLNPSQADEIELIVKDNGTGMTENVKQKIFTPLFTTKDPGKGTGLGLSIVQKLVADMNGRIEIKSTEDVGTEFIMYFKRKGSIS